MSGLAVEKVSVVSLHEWRKEAFTLMTKGL